MRTLSRFLLVGVVAMAVSAPLSGQWDLRQDFREDQFPADWRYQTAPSGSDLFTDLVQLPPGVELPGGSRPANAWVYGPSIQGNRVRSGLTITVERASGATPSDSVFVHPERDIDTVVAWIAPRSGTVQVVGRVGLLPCPSGTNGIIWSIQAERSELWSATFSSAGSRDYSLEVDVEEGDAIRFRLNARGPPFCDHGVVSAGIEFINDELFQRGDVNDDARFDISDGICILENLFFGSCELGCVDAADTNDSGAVDISDAVRVFNTLFVGANEPPAPFPECGLDPTADELNCLSSAVSCG